LSFGLPLLSALAGAGAGWLVSRIVDRFTAPDVRASLLPVPASAIAVSLLAIKFGVPGPHLFVYSGLALVLVGVTVFDIRRQMIPHVVTIPGMIGGLLASTFLLPAGFTESILGLLLGGGILLAATIFETLRKKEIGGGDWKYAAMIGSFIGWQKIIVALVFTGIFGIVGAIALHAAGTHTKPQALGPWLSAGALASILIGNS
jgi:leader peptidase (prepilin peptidase) / N-methyltransferase